MRHVVVLTIGFIVFVALYGVELSDLFLGM
jgi:hypothetical protein